MTIDPYAPIKAKLRSIAEANGHPYLSIRMIDTMMRKLVDQYSDNKSWHPSLKHVDLLLRSVCPYTILSCYRVSDIYIAPRINGLMNEINLKGLVSRWHDYTIGDSFIVASDLTTATFLKLALS